MQKMGDPMLQHETLAVARTMPGKDAPRKQTVNRIAPKTLGMKKQNGKKKIGKPQSFLILFVNRFPLFSCQGQGP